MLTVSQFQRLNRPYLSIKRQNNPTSPVDNAEQTNVSPNFRGGFNPEIYQSVLSSVKLNKLTMAKDSVATNPRMLNHVVPKSLLRNLVATFSNRRARFGNFREDDINKIVDNVTPKNLPFLSDILKIGNNLLASAGVITLLNYADQDNVDPKEFREKIDNFNNLGNIVKGFGFKKSILPDYLNEIPSQGVIDLLKSDILLQDVKHNFNSLPESYNNVVKYYNHQLHRDKVAQDDTFTKVRKAKELMVNNFSNMLLLGMVFDASVCNEFFYNRGQYIKPNYMPRFRMLTNEDLSLLRRVQTSAVTDKENKGGDLAVYEISLDDKISMLNLLSANREIVNSGHEGVNFKDYMDPVNIHNKYGNFKIRFQDLKKDLTYKVLERIGVKSGVIDKYQKNYTRALKAEPDLRSNRDKFWDINYLHLLNAPENSFLRKIILSGTNGEFENWIYRAGFTDSITKPQKTTTETSKDHLENYYKEGILSRYYDVFSAPVKEKLNEVIGLYKKNQLDRQNKEHDKFFEDKTDDYVSTLQKLGMISVINEINRRDFEKNGINYNEYLSPKLTPVTKKFTNRAATREKSFTVKFWKRNPQESLLDGNYTTCCTGIDKDQGESFLTFLTNTFTTTMEVRTEKNKVIAMSRILLAKVNGKLSLVVENIEVNNKIAKHYLYDDKTKYKLREMIFDYARSFAKKINKNEEEMPIYFCGKYYKIADIAKGLEQAKRYEDVELLGAFQNNVYINSYGGRWDKNKITDDGDEFALHLSNITQKAPPVTNNVVSIESDSNYNYADTSNYDHR